MRTSIWLDLIKLIGGFVLLWALFTYVPDLIPDALKPSLFDSDPSLSISIEQEEQLGEFLTDLYFEDADRVDSRSVDSAMWAIENRLIAHIGPTPYEFKFHLIENDQINALTFPGGNIVVFSGLIAFTDTPEEVAAVLAHEIGHAQQRHVVDKLLTELGLTFVLSVVTGGDATLLNEMVRTVLSGVFSRSQEQDADEYGLRMLERSGIDPHAMAAFFRKLNRENLAYDQRLEWLMSHPHNNARIQTSLEYKVGENFEKEAFDIDWKQVKQELE